MELKGSKTEKNLWEAFAGESQARNKYTYFASKAKKEGYEQIASIFTATADNEKEHAKIWFKMLMEGGQIPDTLTCLKMAAAGENEEHTSMYPRMAAEVTKAVKAVCKKPVCIKLSPNVTDIAAIARACEEAGADALSLINTLLSMRIDIRRRKPLLANRTGGLSGPAVFPVAVRMVWDVYEAVDIPILGMGGVSSAEDVVEMLLAGATAVQIGAANLKNPWACKEIAEALPALLESLGVNKLEELIGGAH